MNAHRVRDILNDGDFLALVDLTKASLTRKVMASNATPDDRDKALAEYHALDRLLSRMRSTAQNAKADE